MMNSSESDSEHDSDGGRSGRSGRSCRSITSVGWQFNASVGAGIGDSYRMSRKSQEPGEKDGTLRITQQSTFNIQKMNSPIPLKSAIGSCQIAAAVFLIPLTHGSRYEIKKLIQQSTSNAGTNSPSLNTRSFGTTLAD